MNLEITHKHRACLSCMLSALTLIFVSAQLFLFYTHYKISGLLDSMISSALSHQLWHPVILLPLLSFCLLQILSYVLFVAWLVFLANSIGALFRLAQSQTYFLGLLLWALAIICLLTLNAYYFPDSFFAGLMRGITPSHSANNCLAATTSFLLIVATVIAYVSFFKFRRHVMIANIILLLGFTSCALMIYDTYLTESVSKHTSQHKLPNIIFIGLDSLRPDFTHYFGRRDSKTPTIDNFLRSAVTFSESYTPLGRTFPAWISILTGQYPKHSGARNNLIDPSTISAHDNLAKRLHAAGYETIYATDEKRFSNITQAYGFDKIIGPGMGVNDFILGGLSDFPLTNLLINTPLGQFFYPYNFGNRAAAITYEPNSFLRLVRFGLKQRENKPLFLAIHLCLSHWPFTWANDGMTEHATLVDHYANSVTAVDQQLKQVLQVLQRDGLLDHSLVVLLSDHGTGLGLLGDRLIATEHYVGNPKKLKQIPMFHVDAYHYDQPQGYTINTSYGQGTDVLSLQQHHVLLAFKGFGISLPTHNIATRSSLLDIAPTILDYLHLAPLQSTDGISLNALLSHPAEQPSLKPRAFMLETGYSFYDIEKSHISINNVVSHSVNFYQINPSTGLLSMTDEAEDNNIPGKERAVMLGDWILARYPALVVSLLKFDKNQTGKMEFKTFPPYFILANMKTNVWAMDLSSPIADAATKLALLKAFNTLYGDDLASYVATRHHDKQNDDIAPQQYVKKPQ